MSQIRTIEFCSLSSAPKFLTWLHEIDPTLHEALLTHLRKAEGCGSNRQKMIEILNVLLTNPLHSQALVNFLRMNFPAVLEGELSANINHNTLNRHKIFMHYDPTVATIPRRMIITSLDSARRNLPLDLAVREFCGKQAVSEYIVIEDRGYIEYLPPELGNLAEEIPAKNWQIKRYKSNHNLA